MTSTRPALSRGTEVDPSVVQIQAAVMCLKAVMHAGLIVWQVNSSWDRQYNSDALPEQRYECRDRVTRTDPQGGDRENQASLVSHL